MSENNVTTYPGQIITDLVDWREKAWEEAIEDVVPNDLDSYESSNSEVISYDEDHEYTVHSELATSESLQHLDELLEIAKAKNDGTLFGIDSEVINAVENIKISLLQQNNKPSFFKKS